MTNSFQPEINVYTQRFFGVCVCSVPFYAIKMACSVTVICMSTSLVSFEQESRERRPARHRPNT